jgi:hypothetical protein
MPPPRAFPRWHWPKLFRQHQGPAGAHHRAQQESMMQFNFGDKVKVIGGTLTGTVKGYSFFDTGKKDIYVQHLDKDGFSVTESWIDQTTLELAA